MNTFTIVVYKTPPVLVDGLPVDPMQEASRIVIRATNHRHAVELAMNAGHAFFRVEFGDTSSPAQAAMA
jgi:ribulose 1,5-bisphosphate synthetase/thiazole synthase